MNYLVLDSSVTLAWIYGDETTETIRHIFNSVAENGAVVPSLWRLEVANSLTMAVRRGRIPLDLRGSPSPISPFWTLPLTSKQMLKPGPKR